MAHARISRYLPPDIDPTKAAIAYGCRALPKLNEELQSGDLLTRQKALVALCDLMHDPEYVYEAINIGCLESLKALLKDDDNLVRIKTTEVLYIMATHNIGRVGFLKHDIIEALSLRLSDHQVLCREKLHQAYKHLAQLPEAFIKKYVCSAYQRYQSGILFHPLPQFRSHAPPVRPHWIKVPHTQPLRQGAKYQSKMSDSVAEASQLTCAWLVREPWPGLMGAQLTSLRSSGLSRGPHSPHQLAHANPLQERDSRGGGEWRICSPGVVSHEQTRWTTFSW
ncbi:radial spoke head 14 homolog isoform X3 [Mastomys coucha]|uniref:radial spoke head 14 homolog isoform X3 n=1 Tax=Mastomys coucha TaxID=35658 RepID=UPI001261EA27|nr:radial spoke head 14 homolog isoform X3 [Mastomys coucha]